MEDLSDVCLFHTLSLCTHAVMHCVVQILTSTSASTSALEINQTREIPESAAGAADSEETEEVLPLARARSSAPAAAVI